MKVAQNVEKSLLSFVESFMSDFWLLEYIQLLCEYKKTPSDRGLFCT